MSQRKVPEQLLRLMADGEFHSGERIGELLGVSRAAVWKQLQKLEELGLQLESVKGKGYRLSAPLDFLSAEIIREKLSGLWVPEIVVHDVIDSTNAEVLRAINSGAVSKAYTVLAEMQQSGRGRRGRQWISPYGRNVYLSLPWSFERGMASLDGLSLVVGLCVVKALEVHCTRALQLKWPNDVLCDGRKLAGILLEIVGDPTGLCHVVIGIGINVNWQKEGASTGIDQPWTSVLEINGEPCPRNALVASLLHELIRALPIFDQQGFAPFMQEWQRYDAFRDCEVAIQLGERFIFGTAAGVTDKGEIRIVTSEGIQVFNGGEVSLRRKA